jgi:uncharacterized protein DUF4114/PEP-CTERM motif-containing protein
MSIKAGTIIVGLLGSVALLVTPVIAWAVPILGGSTFVGVTGDVIATFVGSDAGYTSELILDTPGNSLGVIFTNHSTLPGTTHNLGTFAAGTELIFRIHVLNTGNDFFTGSASRNPDNVAHALVDSAYGPNQTLIAFEDLFGGGDQDYNDHMFSFTNVASTISNPEPATLLLLASGLAGLAGWRQGRAKKA